MEDPAGRHTVAGALLDERSTPSLRERFGELAARSKSLAVAIRRVRLPGVDLSADELRQVSRVRVLLGQLDAGTFVAEADAVMVDPLRREASRPTPLAPPDGDRGRPNRSRWSPGLRTSRSSPTAHGLPMPSTDATGFSDRRPLLDLRLPSFARGTERPWAPNGSRNCGAPAMTPPQPWRGCCWVRSGGRARASAVPKPLAQTIDSSPPRIHLNPLCTIPA